MHSTHLSVNLNKVALIRNTRHLGIPSLIRAANQCLEAGASGITLHPRPDERHIRAHDVADIAAMMKDWPAKELNIEGNPLQNLMGERFVNAYIHVKEKEYQTYFRVISSWEREFLLLNV